MSESEKGGGGGSDSSPSMSALKRIDDRLSAYHAIIRKKRNDVLKLENDRDAAVNDDERKMLNTTIKAMKLDLEEEERLLDGLEEDNRAAKQAVVEEEQEGETEGEDTVTRGKATYTADEMERMMRQEVERRLTARKQDTEIAAINSRMDRLLTTLARATPLHSDGATAATSSTGTSEGGERRRTLGQTPVFTTGQSDFITHIEAFKDFTQLNDINHSEKVKRLFLTTLDQKARMRCAGLEPDRAPCLTMSADDYIARLQELFVPRATLLIVQQAFHDLKQKPSELASDYVLAKWGYFRRGWSSPNAPFSFFYEAATIGLYDEGLRNEIFRDVITCADSNSRVEMNAAFQSYLEKVQQSLAYVRRTGSTANPDSRGLGITGQPTKSAARAATGISEFQRVEQLGEEEEEESDEVEEIDEQMIAFAEALEDERFTQLVMDDYHSINEAENKRCFLCHSPHHLARSCGMRMRNLSSAMGRMGFRSNGWGRRGGRGGRWRGAPRGSSRGPARGRTPPLSGFPTQLPPSGPSIRPITSSQPGHHRPQDF